MAIVYLVTLYFIALFFLSFLSSLTAYRDKAMIMFYYFTIIAIVNIIVAVLFWLLV